MICGTSRQQAIHPNQVLELYTFFHYKARMRHMLFSRYCWTTIPIILHHWLHYLVQWELQSGNQRTTCLHLVQKGLILSIGGQIIVWKNYDCLQFSCCLQYISFFRLFLCIITSPRRFQMEGSGFKPLHNCCIPTTEAAWHLYVTVLNCSKAVAMFTMILNNLVYQ